MRDGEAWPAHRDERTLTDTQVSRQYRLHVSYKWTALKKEKKIQLKYLSVAALRAEGERERC